MYILCYIFSVCFENQQYLIKNKLNGINNYKSILNQFEIASRDVVCNSIETFL